MTAILSQAISAMLDNYADVIEGGNFYRGSGTAYKGVAGTQSFAEYAGGTILSEAGSTTTSILAANTYGTNRFVKSDIPPWFLYSSIEAARPNYNLGGARKISAVSSTGFTTAAWPLEPTVGDTFVLREGFKRAPDNWDIESEEDTGADDAFDRFFSLSLLPGKRLPIYGNQTEFYEGELELRLRILKRSRARRVIDSALENVLFMRSTMTRPENRDGTYMQLVEAESTTPEKSVDDLKRVVVKDKYRVIFRVGADFI